MSSPILATERLAEALVRGSVMFTENLSAEDVDAAVKRLADRFQTAWIEEVLSLAAFDDAGHPDAPALSKTGSSTEDR